MAGKGKTLGKLVATVRMYIPAGIASPSPPLGPALGQVQSTSVCEWYVIHLCELSTIPLERGEHWTVLQRVQRTDKEHKGRY